MSKCYIVGGAGFIASHVVDALLDQGNRVMVYDDFSSGKMQHLERQGGRVELSDSLDNPFLQDAVVYDFAASVDISKSYVDPFDYVRKEITLTLKVLEAAAQRHAERVIFISSSGVYDRQDHGQYDELFHSIIPATPYAASKMMGEVGIQMMSQVCKIPCLSVRPFNVYGPRQRVTGIDKPVVPTFILSILTGKPITIEGKGDQRLDFIYVKDAARWLAGLAQVNPELLEGGAVNLGRGKNLSIKDLAKVLMRMTKKMVPIEHAPTRKWFFSNTQASISQMQRIFPIQWTSLEQGLQETIQYYQAQLEAQFREVEEGGQLNGRK